MGGAEASPDATDPRIERTRRVVSRWLWWSSPPGATAPSPSRPWRAAAWPKSTIYRHWPGKLALIADALETLNVQTPGEPRDGTAPRSGSTSCSATSPAPSVTRTITGCTPALIEAAEHDLRCGPSTTPTRPPGEQALVAAIADGVTRRVLPRDRRPRHRRDRAWRAPSSTAAS